MIRPAILWVFGALAVSTATGQDRPTTVPPVPQQHIPKTNTFIPNYGQFPQQVLYAIHDREATLYFAADGVILNLPVERDPSLSGFAVKVSFPGAGTPSVKVLNPSTHRVNYYRGQDPSDWKTDLPTYRTLVYENLYPGIHAEFRSYAGRLKYQFIVTPGADPKDIRVRYEGVQWIEPDSNGGLRLLSDFGDLQDEAPQSYQRRGSQRTAVSSSYILEDPHTVTFDIGLYDPSSPLVIDPAITYATYLGSGTSGSPSSGLDDQTSTVRLDPSGNVYIAGSTNSDFPTTAGAYNKISNGGYDVFVAKLSADGSALVWSTYLGGSGTDYGYRLTLDSNLNVYVIGPTTSTNFPTTTGTYDASTNGSWDAYIARIKSDGGALLWSTYLGGSSLDVPRDISLGASGDLYVTGYTVSTDFPTTSGSYDTTYNGGEDVFVTRIKADGTALAYSTFVGGPGNDQGARLWVSSLGTHIVGSTQSPAFPTTTGAFNTTFNGYVDAFVTVLNDGGSSLAWSTFLGGTSLDVAYAVTVTSGGSTYVAGYTASSNFPATPNAYDSTHNGGIDAFAAEIAPGGSSLSWATFLGSSSSDRAFAIVVDSQEITLCGTTLASPVLSTPFPTTPGAYDTTPNGGTDGFVARMKSDGTTLLWSTYLGGSTADNASSFALDGSGNVVMVGTTDSSDFPTSSSAYDKTHNGGNDVFVTKIASSGASVSWSTFLGGETSLDEAYGITLAADGSPIVAGVTMHAQFPTTPGAYDTSHNGEEDIFVSRLTSDWTKLSWSTYIGGSKTDKTDFANSLTQGSTNALYVIGYTLSPDFPVTSGTLQGTNKGTIDAVLFRMKSTDGTLDWSTYLGGSGGDYGMAVAADANDTLYVTGYTNSTDFPTTSSAYQTTKKGLEDIFACRLTSTGGSLTWSTYLGGTKKDFSSSLALETTGGKVAIGGYTQSTDFPISMGAYQSANKGDYDGLVTWLNTADGAFKGATYLGGAMKDYVTAIGANSKGNLVVGGAAASDDFPTTPGTFQSIKKNKIDAFSAEIDPTNNILLWSTFLGGDDDDWVWTLTTDSTDNVYLGGFTKSPDFPTVGEGMDTTPNGEWDAFVTRVTSGGKKLDWSTFLGGSRNDQTSTITLSKTTGNVLAAGITNSPDFPMSATAYDKTFNAGSDIFIVEIAGGSSVVSPVQSGSGTESGTTTGPAPRHKSPLKRDLISCHGAIGAEPPSGPPPYQGLLLLPVAFLFMAYRKFRSFGGAGHTRGL